jgi:ATP-dependent DNA ligase
LELDGEDLRPRPLGERKAMLAKLLDRKTGGILFNEHRPRRWSHRILACLQARIRGDCVDKVL